MSIFCTVDFSLVFVHVLVEDLLGIQIWPKCLFQYVFIFYVWYISTLLMIFSIAQIVVKADNFIYFLWWYSMDLGRGGHRKW
jgi:hypothetical protein